MCTVSFSVNTYSLELVSRDTWHLFNAGLYEISTPQQLITTVSKETVTISRLTATAHAHIEHYSLKSRYHKATTEIKDIIFSCTARCFASWEFRFPHKSPFVIYFYCQSQHTRVPWIHTCRNLHFPGVWQITLKKQTKRIFVSCTCFLNVEARSFPSYILLCGQFTHVLLLNLFSFK